MKQEHYRADIDGVRGLAVILVILFHAKLGFPGGYIGVDVFFVVSGFVISRLILREQAESRFHLGAFWIKRIRRLIPAAFVMVVATLLVGAIALPTDAYSSLAKSAIAQQLLVANVYFFRAAGYFAGAAEEFPLLHTWSLAVEEQFYLIYPFFLFLTASWSRRARLLSIGIVAAISFWISWRFLGSHPDGVFYLLPGRVWELMLGAMICFFPRDWFPTGRVAEGLSVLGAVFVLGPSMLYTSQTPFPGMNAILPCVGTACWLMANETGKTVVGTMFSSSLISFIGKISYSLYLWHWPVLSLFGYWYGGNIALVTKVLLLVVIAGLSLLSWRFVEQPFRKGYRSGDKFIDCLRGLMMSTVSVVGGSALIVLLGGVPGRMPASVERFRVQGRPNPFNRSVELDMLAPDKAVYFGDKDSERTCLMWGDSHAMAYLPGLDQACRDVRVRGIQATFPSNPPVLDFVYRTKYGLNSKGIEYNKRVVELATETRVGLVVMAGSWPKYSVVPDFEIKLRETLRALQAAGIPAVVVLDVAHFPENPRRVLGRMKLFGEPLARFGMAEQAVLEASQACNDKIRAAAAGLATVVDPTSEFLDGRGMYRADRDDVSLYDDETHLSLEGGLLMSSMFTRILEQHFNPKGE